MVSATVEHRNGIDGIEGPSENGTHDGIILVAPDASRYAPQDPAVEFAGPPLPQRRDAGTGTAQPEHGPPVDRAKL